MQQTLALIERVRRSGAHSQQLSLSISPSLKHIQPGHSFLTPGRNASFDPYLLERWWPIHCQENQLVVECPFPNDSPLRRYEPGEGLTLLGPIGQPLPFQKKLRHVLLIAEDCQPHPLRLAIDRLLDRQACITLVLLGTAANTDVRSLDPRVEVSLGAPREADPRHWPEQVLSVGWADQVFITTAAEGQRARFAIWRRRFGELRNGVPAKFLWGLFTPTWPCGAGACGACDIATRDGVKYTCRHGPALDLTRCRLDGH